METKLTKVFIDGKEYLVTDKQAQQMLEVVNNRVDAIEKEIENMKDPANYWLEIR